MDICSKVRGIRLRAIQVRVPDPLILRLTLIPTHSHSRFLTRTCTVKQSPADVLEPLSQSGTNQRDVFQVSPALAPLGAGVALAASPQYLPPYSAAFGVQNARPLPPGPVPQGVAAFGLAMPSQQQS